MAEKVLNVADKETLDLVYEKLSGTEASLIVKSVRHIQRGKMTTSSATTANPSVTLSGFTDLDKMIVLVDGCMFMGSGKYQDAYLNNLTLTSVTFLPSNGANLSYQVIEFY